MIPSDSAASNPAPPNVRLNVFALPTRTTLLFALIILVIALPLLASFGSGSPICAPFIVFWMLLLPLRDFLRRPDSLREQYALTDARERFPMLTQRWGDLARTCAQIKPPRLLLTARDATLFTFGTFTRRFVAMSQPTANELERALSAEATRARGEAVLLHELAHFVHHDVEMAYFSRSVLKITVFFMTLNFFVLALTPWLYNYGRTFFDFRHMVPEELLNAITMGEPALAQALVQMPVVEPVVWLRYEAFVLSAHAPLILGSLILGGAYWRALLRTRELYADARVAQWQRTIQPLWEQLLRTQTFQVLQPRVANAGEKIRQWVTQWRLYNPLGWHTPRGWFSAHPTLAMRRECLDHPERIYGGEVTIGATAGLTVVLLNLTLGSLLLSRYLRGPNSGVPFLVGFSVLALSLLPSLLALEQPRAYAKKITRVVLIFTIIKLVPQYLAGLGLTAALLADPSLVDQAAYALVPGAGANPVPTGIPLEFVLWVFVIAPMFLFTLGMPLILILWLRWDAWLKRRVLRWYGAPWLARHPTRVFSAITVFLAAMLGMILLPILDALTIPTAHDLFDPLTLGGMSLALIAFGIGGTYFRSWDRRYADRCPQCGAAIAGDYVLGKQCLACGTRLHPSLVAI